MTVDLEGAVREAFDWGRSTDDALPRLATALKKEYGLDIVEVLSMRKVGPSGDKIVLLFELTPHKATKHVRQMWLFGASKDASEAICASANTIIAKKMKRDLDELLRRVAGVPDDAPCPFRVYLPPIGLSEAEEAVFRVGGSRALLRFLEDV